MACQKLIKMFQYDLLQNEVLGWDFASDEPGKNTEGNLERVRSYFSRDRETVQTCKMMYFHKGCSFQSAHEKSCGFPTSRSCLITFCVCS